MGPVFNDVDKILKPPPCKSYKEFVNNWLVDHLEKCGVFFNYKYGFKCLCLMANLLEARVARTFSVSGATQIIALHTSKAFGRIWHIGLFQKLKSYRILSWIFSLYFFIS